MALNDLAPELLPEIIILVASDIQSLKSITLVNRQLGHLGRVQLFARYPVNIYESRPGGFRNSLAAKSPDFMALLNASPDLATLILRVRLAVSQLTQHAPLLPAALKKLVNIQSLEIAYNFIWDGDWTKTTISMQECLLNAILPRLTSLIIAHPMTNFPCNLLDYAPLLTSLSILKRVGIGPPHINNSNSISLAKRPLHQLNLAEGHYGTALPISMLQLLEGKVESILELTILTGGEQSLSLFQGWLGRFVNRLNMMSRHAAYIPFNYLSSIETLQIMFNTPDYQVDRPGASSMNHRSAISWLNASLLGHEDLPLTTLIIVFKSFPIRFRAGPLMKASFAECDNLLEGACPRLKSVHATFSVNRKSKLFSQFTLGGVKGELGGLLPRCFEKGFLSVENVTPDPSPWKD
ncbi:hypothetical protein DL96DRAFT_1813044 [Flagelloscypha sp. PMI_526]|nr:hypothetical protein DL96DRAFT_1813044 [Flagelloscypha sp. PMI_526]